MGKSAVLGTDREQHLDALEHANRVRLARADLKRRIAAGQLAASEVVMDCPWESETMSISDLLMSQKRWGRARCRRLLTSAGIPENKRLGTLTERQRLALAAMMGGAADPSSTVGHTGAASLPALAATRALSAA